MKTDLRSRVSGPLSGRVERTTGNLQRAPTAPPAPTAEAAPDRTHDLLTSLRRKFSPSEFNTAMVHFYRGEVQRSNTWRNRLDTTTNWAVLTAGATLSFAFSAPSNPPFVILINSLLVFYFLIMEARRYRYYEIWSSRVRVMETGYFAQLLSPDSKIDEEWAAQLADDLITPHFTISEWEAVGRRLRRNYLWIFALLALSWNLKVYLHPTPARDFDMFIARAGVGVVPGHVVFAVGVIFNAVMLVFALATVRLKEATGEVLPTHEFSLDTFRRMTDWTRTAAEQRRRVTVHRTKRARARVRSRVGAPSSSAAATTGEWTKTDSGAWKKPGVESIHETIT